MNSMSLCGRGAQEQVPLSHSTLEWGGLGSPFAQNSIALLTLPLSTGPCCHVPELQEAGRLPHPLRSELGGHVEGPRGGEGVGGCEEIQTYDRGGGKAGGQPQKDLGGAQVLPDMVLISSTSPGEAASCSSGT